MPHSDRGTFGHHSFAVVSTLKRIAGSTTGEGVFSPSPTVRVVLEETEVVEELSKMSSSVGSNKTGGREGAFVVGAGVGLGVVLAGDGVAKYLSQSVRPLNIA